MKSVPPGSGTSAVEVSGISVHGIWLFLGDRELFLPFEKFPWFRDASVAGVLHVERPRPDHLYWPDLDIDLAVESILDPDKFPLISRGRTDSRHEAKPRRARAKTSTRHRRR